MTDHYTEAPVRPGWEDGADGWELEEVNGGDDPDAFENGGEPTDTRDPDRQSEPEPEPDPVPQIIPLFPAHAPSAPAPTEPAPTEELAPTPTAAPAPGPWPAVPSSLPLPEGWTAWHLVAAGVVLYLLLRD